MRDSDDDLTAHLRAVEVSRETVTHTMRLIRLARTAIDENRQRTREIEGRVNRLRSSQPVRE